MTPPLLPPDLAGKRAAARALLWFERLWPAVWPALGVIGVYAAAALLDLPSLLPPLARAGLPVLVLLLALLLLALGVRRLTRPGIDDADRRLERASGLRHRPLATLADRPAGDSKEAWAIWHLHQARVAAQVRRLRVGWPHPGLPGRDRRALRFLVVLGVLAGLVVAGADAPARLWRAAVPGLPPIPAGPATVVQAWATPPAYTGLPPLFLQPGTTSVSMPTGAHLTVSVTGGTETPALFLDADATPFRALDAGSWQAERDLSSSGRLAVRRGLGDIAGWLLTVIPDNPPTAVWAEPPGPAQAAGRATTQTRLAWRAEDDYGVVGVQAELRLAQRMNAAPLVIPAAPSGSPKQAHGVFVHDLTAHPWAGLEVRARVVARDALSQTGSSEDANFTLPERLFHNPAAQAVIAIRKQLSLTPESGLDAARALSALADRPEMYDNSLSIGLELYATGSLLARGRGEAAVSEAQGRMWELALALEEGAVDRTAQTLAEARQAMRDAMDAVKQDPTDPQKQAELEKRMQELRDAIQRHIEALAEQARREGTDTPLDPTLPQMNARDLDRMAQEMEKSAREGHMDDAQRQMAELERMLEQLQNARPQTSEERQQRNAERRQQGRQQQDAVQDLVRREMGLMDRSRTRSETPQAGPQPPQRGAQQPGQQPGQQPQAQQRSQQGQQPGQQAGQTPSDRARDQRAQQAMRRALGELMQRFGDLTGQIPAPLGEADLAMRDAAQATAESRDADASEAQQKAIEALQKGNRQMGQQMARQFGRGQPQQGEGEGEDGQDGQEMGDGSQAGPDGNALGNGDGQTTGPRPGDQGGPARRRTTRRDPLGRPLNEGTSGTDESSDVRVPDDMEMARTRALQEELRRRGAERTRPQNELDYIDRLLNTY